MRLERWFAKNYSAKKNLKIQWSNGVLVTFEENSICFDPRNSKFACGYAFISHAHRDHTGGLPSEKPKFSTKATADIFEASSNRKIMNIKKLSYGDHIRVGDAEATVYDSGHILGAAIFKLDTPQGSVGFTGDLNCVDTVVTSGAEPFQCDTLIIESTYGRPDLIFPPREDVYKHMVRWVVETISGKKIPAFYVYTVGKAQEIIRMLNEFTEVQVIVHPAIAKINRVYEDSRVKLDFSVDDRPQKTYGKCAVVYPNNVPSSDRLEVPAYATGWALIFKDGNTAFPLSSHADFPQLINFVKNVKPKKVYTCFGSNSSLANSIRREKGIDAEPLH